MKKRAYIQIVLLALLVACKQSDDSFNFVDVPSQDDATVGPATIVSYSPTAATTVQCVSQVSNPRCGTSGSLTTGSSQTYTVSVTGTSPLTYVWKLNGAVISGATSSIYNLSVSPSTVTAGNYTLTVEVANAEGSDSHSFTVKVNEPPTLSGASPTNAETLGVNYAGLRTLAINGADANSDAITYTWTLDNNVVARLAGSAIAGGSQGVYSPVVGDVGTRTIKVTATDANSGETGAGRYDPITYSWTMNVNYLSTDCNELSAGGICTVIGRPGLMTDSDSDGVYNPLTEVVKIRPNYVIDDGSGNLFISDSANHVVWFYNRSGASVNRIGLSIASGKIRPLVGNGGAGATTDDSATYANTAYKLFGPQGMHYDSVNDYLYIADYYNHRVVRIDNTGKGRRVFGLGVATPNNAASNGNGVLATNHYCPTPTGLVVTGTFMYVACTWGHVIKRVDISNPTTSLWTAQIQVGRVNAGGTTTAGTVDAANGYGTTTAQTQYPMALALDQWGNLYFTENNSCRVRVSKLNASPANYFNAGLAAPASGNTGTLLGTGGCGEAPSVYTADVAYTAFATRDARGLTLKESAGTIDGFFITSGIRHLLYYVNNTGVAQTFGNNAIAAAQAGIVWGVYTVGTYSGDGTSAVTKHFNSPKGLMISGSTLYVSDSLNFRVRTLDLSVGNGATSTVAGGVAGKHGNSSDSNIDPTTFVGYYLDYLFYNSATSKIYFGDNTHGTAVSWNTQENMWAQINENGRIRAFDVTSGLINTLAGNGFGAGNLENEPSSTVLTQGIRGMTAMSDGSLLYASTYRYGGGATRDCMVRALNLTGSTQSYFGVAGLLNNTVTSIAGSYTNGCNTFTGGGGAATSARIYYPEGIAYDGSNLYISSYQQHCILKVTNTGTITSHIGSCGAPADVVGTLATTRFQFPMALLTDPRYPTNFFIADQSNQSSASIKYVNLSGTDCNSGTCDVAGASAPDQNTVNAFPVTGGYPTAIAYWVESGDPTKDLVCYTSGSNGAGVTNDTVMTTNLGSHNVTCKERQSGNLSLRIGQADGSLVKSGSQLDQEDEGTVKSGTTLSVKLNTPSGIAFDSLGNLYISERESHVIRKVKKWW